MCPPPPPTHRPPRRGCIPTPIPPLAPPLAGAAATAVPLQDPAGGGDGVGSGAPGAPGGVGGVQPYDFLMDWQVQGQGQGGVDEAGNPSGGCVPDYAAGLLQGLAAVMQQQQQQQLASNRCASTCTHPCMQQQRLAACNWCKYYLLLCPYEERGTGPT